jgi:8-oxo-dGTP pyrophosphatase MutT (NUDIX family)
MGTVNTDGLPEELQGKAWRVGGVGGGQEPGESIWECSTREAFEEIGVEVSLSDSPISIFHDIDVDRFYSFTHTGSGRAPILLERKSIPGPEVPFKPGLPTGEFLYLALFLAEPVSPQARFLPSDDVIGLIGLPVQSWIRLPVDQPNVRSTLAQGIELIGDLEADGDRVLWTPPDESVVSLARAIVSRRLQKQLSL